MKAKNLLGWIMAAALVGVNLYGKGNSNFFGALGYSIAMFTVGLIPGVLIISALAKSKGRVASMADRIIAALVFGIILSFLVH
jgi:hypothetical protein